MKRNVHQKVTFVGIRALAFRYSEAKAWHNALLRHSGNLNNDKSTPTEPYNKVFNMELPLNQKKFSKSC